MKRLILTLAVLITAVTTISARDIRDILNSLGKTDTTATSSSSSSKSSGLSSIIGAVNKLTGNDKVSYADIVGTWVYSAPAVSFKGDNLLKNAGGVAAATAVEKKIEPYYQKIGFNDMAITFESDSTFVMNVRKLKINGTVSQHDSESFTFKFNALNKVKIGEMHAYINSEASNKISLTFDATKLISLVDKISKIAGSTSLSAISSMLNSYDGMTLGFKLDKKAGEASTSASN